MAKEDTSKVVPAEERTRYSDEELEEFRQISNDMLAKARKE